MERSEALELLAKSGIEEAALDYALEHSDAGSIDELVRLARYATPSQLSLRFGKDGMLAAATLARGA